MTADEFSRRVRALAIKSRATLAAYNVLHDGASINSQARECGVDVGYLSRLCSRIRNAQLCECCGQAIRPEPIKDAPTMVVDLT